MEQFSARALLEIVGSVCSIAAVLGAGVAYFIKQRESQRNAPLEAPRQTGEPDVRATDPIPPRAPAEYAFGSVVSIICALLWSLSYVSLKKVSDDGVSVLQINVVLLGSAAVFLFLGSLAWRWSEGARRSGSLNYDAMPFGVLVAANLGNFLLSVYALVFVSASHAMTLNNMFPLFLAVILVFRRKLSLSIANFLVLALVSVGTWVITADDDFSIRSGSQLYGSLAAILAGVSFAVWADRVDDIEARAPSMSDRLMSLALVFLTTYALVISVEYLIGESPRYPVTDLVILIGNGFRVAAVYVLFQVAISYAGPLIPTIIVVLQVPLTMMFEHILLDTPIPNRLIVGAVAIGIGGASLVGNRLYTNRNTGGV